MSLFEEGEFDPEWFQGLFRTGAIMTAILVMNALSYLKMKGLEYEVAMYGEMMPMDRGGTESSEPNLLVGQLEVMAGTYTLVAIVWRAVRAKGKETARRGRAGLAVVMTGVIQKLLAPFWLAALGIGSVFGVSAGFGLTEVLSHVELLFGPPLILAVELTFSWIVLKFLLNYY